MCENPIQYTRDFIVSIKSGEKTSLINTDSLVKQLITHDFLENIKIIEKLSIDNIPTHTIYKNKGGNSNTYGKKKNSYLKENLFRKWIDPLDGKTRERYYNKIIKIAKECSK